MSVRRPQMHGRNTVDTFHEQDGKVPLQLEMERDSYITLGQHRIK